MKKFRVYLYAFGEGGRVREVEVPNEAIEDISNEHAVAEEVFRYGQNDIAPSYFRSVSVEDVIEVNGLFLRVDFAGFTRVVPIFAPLKTQKVVREYADSLEGAVTQ